MIAKIAHATGRGVYELVLEKKLMTEGELDRVLQPENLTKPVAIRRKKGAQ